MSIRFPLLAALLLALPVAASAAEFSSLEERMSGEDFRAAGLERLSPDELARLNDWLRRNWPHSAAAAAQAPAGATQEDRRGLFESPAADGPIISRIEGTFTGWNSNTSFRLENGMVWRVAEAASLSARPIENPAVTIEPGVFSAWYLQVEGYNSKVKVRRVE